MCHGHGVYWWICYTIFTRCQVVSFWEARWKMKKELCKEQKTGQYRWVSNQICRNHFDWSNIGMNYHIMMIQCFIGKTVVISIIRYGVALASPPTFMHERGIQPERHVSIQNIVHHPGLQWHQYLAFQQGGSSNMKYCCENTMKTKQQLRISQYKPNPRKLHTCLYCMIISYH